MSASSIQIVLSEFYFLQKEASVKKQWIPGLGKKSTKLAWKNLLQQNTHRSIDVLNEFSQQFEEA